LLDKKYDVVRVQGKYIENYGKPDAVEVGENVFFVIDAYDKGELLKDFRELGEKFQQDSILFIPKGGNKKT